MNDFPDERLSFDEIARFRSIVILPHVPNAIRLSDTYTLYIPIFTPGVPLVHKFIWGNRGYLGFDSKKQYRYIFNKDAAAEYVKKEGHSTMSYLTRWSMQTLWTSKRYFWKYTEFATLKGLQHFESLHDLFNQLESLFATEGGDEKGRAIQKVMQKYHRKLVFHSTQWWTNAISTAWMN